MSSCLGIYISDNKVLGVLLEDTSGKELFRYSIDTPNNYSDFFQAILAIINKAYPNIYNDCYIGVGIPGLVLANKTILHSLPFLKEDFILELEKEIKHKVYVENDAKCFALSEHLDGAAKGYQTALCLTLDTRIGGAIVVDNQILCGPNFLTGEWGFLSLPFPKENEISFSKDTKLSFSIASMISSPALVHHYNEQGGKHIFLAKEMILLAKEGDLIAKEVLNLFYDRLARCFLSFMYIFDPEVIVLGGELSEISDIYTEIPKILAKYTKNMFSQKAILNLRASPKGRDSGVFGTAYLWKYQDFFNKGIR